ncbi:MAG: hypothetical protein LBP36_01670 [Oscillospiraceae bacterium]|nr:hypothetical protein [Oscillospiraceae bacterium]
MEWSKPSLNCSEASVVSVRLPSKGVFVRLLPSHTCKFNLWLDAPSAELGITGAGTGIRAGFRSPGCRVSKSLAKK